MKLLPKLRNNLSLSNNNKSPLKLPQSQESQLSPSRLMPISLKPLKKKLKYSHQLLNNKVLRKKRKSNQRSQALVDLRSF